MSGYFEPTDYELVEDGAYDAVVTKQEVRESEQWGDYLRWEFSVSREDGTQFSLVANSAKAGGKGSKPWRWTKAALGEDLVPGIKPDVVGKQCQVIIGHRETEKGEFNTVTEVMAPRKRATAKSSTLNLERLDGKVFADAIPF